jgi:NADH-quinone oxidoreductase subunit L/multicomponent Na+:H+ antiporter subunit D
MAGIGRRMPLTMAAFGVASLGMAGIPLVAGFVSKWYLLIGAFDVGAAVFAVALLISGVLNVAYFWPVVYQAFFETPDDHDRKPLVSGPLGGRFAGAGAVADGGKGEAGADGPDPVEADAAAEAGGPDAGTVDRPATDETTDGTAAGDERTGTADRAERSDDHADEHAHHGGPPAGGWESRNWLGAESTWFMLGPILTAMAGSLALGIAPRLFVFLRIVQEIVAGLAGVAG